MADVLLDATLETVKCALSQSYLDNEITIETDYANFRVTLTLKNWASLKDGETKLNKEKNFAATNLDEGKNLSALMEDNVSCTPSPLAYLSHVQELRPVIVKLEHCEGFQLDDAVKIEDSDEASNFDHDTENKVNFDRGYPEIERTGLSEDALKGRTDIRSERLKSLKTTSSLAVGPQKLSGDRNLAEARSEKSAVTRKQKREKLTREYL